MKRSVLLATLMVLVLSGFAMAQTGYFAQTAPSGAKTIPAGPTTNPGPAVEIASVTVIPGTYLITARVDAQSYAPNSGAVCFLSTPVDPYGVANMSQALNTSSDWTALTRVNSILLGQTITTAGKVSLTCQKGYSFTGGSQAWGTLMLVKIN